MKGKTLSLLMAIWMIGLAFVSLAPNSMAGDVYINSSTRIHLDSNNYPGGIPSTWYYPGDTITGWLEGRPTGGQPPPADGNEDILDVVVWSDDPMTGGCDVGTLPQVLLQANNIALDSTSGKGIFSFAGTSTQFLSDGPYCAYVAPSDYIEGVAAGPYANRNIAFQIHEYNIQASTDKGGYIPGNTVFVYYLVSRIKDGSPMTMTGYQSNWVVQSSDGYTYAFGSLAQSTGQFQFTISNNGGVTPPEAYPVMIWYNNTGGGANRRAFLQLNVEVGNLACNIVAPPGGAIYAPGAVIEIDVAVDATPFGSFYNYPDAGVVIKILDGATITSPEMPAYTKTFTSDGAGMVKYAFVLDSAVFLDGKTYTISANATSILKYASDMSTFTMRKSLETMSVRLTLDKDSYYSDETAVMTVAAQWPAGHTQPSTYVYTVYASGAVFALVSTNTATYSFHIPANFEGTLTFSVDVYNVEGDYGQDSESADVWFGVIVVNANPQEYNANDVITVNFELKSTVMTGAATTFYYTVNDGSKNVKEGNVNTGGSLSGSVQYTIPNVPSQQYTFTIYANAGGHIVSNSAIASLTQGFILTIKFDKTSYNAGDTMAVEYKIAARVSGTPLPRVFGLSYGLAGYPSVSFMTTSDSGKVNYVVPAGANEGPTLFSMMDSATGAYAVEVVTIGPAPEPIRLFDAFLLVLIVILFLLVLALRGRGAGAGTPKPKEEKAAAPPPPGQQISPMIVNCKACGAPIEITTSKRPIEVMCPSCGETAMVQ